MKNIIVSKRGTIKIPVEILEKYNLKAGSKVVVVDYGGMLTITPAVEDAIKKGYGFLKGASSMKDDLKKDREREAQRDLRLAKS